MPYIKKTTISGRMLEVEKYYASHVGRNLVREQAAGISPKDQVRQNAKNATRHLQRMIMANFTHRDYMITYTHAEDITERKARAEIRNLIDRIRRLYQKAKIPAHDLKYIIVTEKQSKWHHHVIIKRGLPLEELMEAWGNRGRAKPEKLDVSAQCENLAVYLTGEHKPPKGQPNAENIKEPRGKYQKRWRGSRNLKKPVVTERKVTARPQKNAMPKPPKGYRLLPDWVNICDGNGNWYQRYVCLEEGGGE